jgi:SPP1 family predicted phage head-tail adaptor
MSVFQSLLNNDFAVSRRRRSPDGQGGWAIDYVPNGTVRGRIRPATSRERVEAQQESRDITHVLYVVHGEDIERGDRVVTGPSTGSGQALTVDVEAIREPSKAGEHLEIDCLERQPEQSVEEGS